MNRIIWLALIVSSEALLPIPAVALLYPEETKPTKNQNYTDIDEVEITVSSTDGKTYLKTSFGRLPGGELRPNCIEDKDIPLPIGFYQGWSLFGPDPIEKDKPLYIKDLVILIGPMTGEWRYKSRKALRNGLLVKWTRDDNSSIQTFIPWAGIYSEEIERSQFDAPLCRG